MTMQAVGYGSGTYDLPGQANLLRIVLGDTNADSTSEPLKPCTSMIKS